MVEGTLYLAFRLYFWKSRGQFPIGSDTVVPRTMYYLLCRTVNCNFPLPYPTLSFLTRHSLMQTSGRFCYSYLESTRVGECEGEGEGGGELRV